MRRENQSVRCPMRIGGEETVYESNLKHNKEPEGDADYSRCDCQPPTEWGEALARIGNGGADDHGDHHHARDSADAEDQKIGDCPTWIADCRKHEQGDSSGSRQTMHN